METNVDSVGLKRFGSPLIVQSSLRTKNKQIVQGGREREREGYGLDFGVKGFI